MICSGHWLLPVRRHWDREHCAEKDAIEGRRTASGQNENCCHRCAGLDVHKDVR